MTALKSSFSFPGKGENTDVFLPSPMVRIRSEINRLTGDVYRGKPMNGSKKAVVTVNDKPLPPRLDLAYMSAGGFNWGYGGAGPGQLALAVLAHAAGDEVALAEWDRFREEVIKQLEMTQSFRFTAHDVRAFLQGVPVDARKFIRPVRKSKCHRSIWQRLRGKAA